MDQVAYRGILASIRLALDRASYEGCPEGRDPDSIGLCGITKTAAEAAAIDPLTGHERPECRAATDQFHRLLHKVPEGRQVCADYWLLGSLWEGERGARRKRVAARVANAINNLLEEGQ